MQFTPQQLVGAGRYSATTRIGNWNEDLMLEEARMKEYRAQKQKGGLGTAYRRKMEQANGRVPHSYEEDGVLKYNSYVVLEHIQTAGCLACDVWEETRVGSGEFILSVTRQPNLTTARTTFLIVSPTSQSGIIRYGEPFRLLANEALRVDLQTNTMLPPLYLKSNLKNERYMSPISSNQNVSLSTVADNSTLWIAVRGDASGTEKMLAVTTPVSTHDVVGIQHKMTGVLLHADAKFIVATEFGPETEVSCSTVKGFGKTFNLKHERHGDRTSETHAKETHSPNLWRLALGKSPSAATECRSLPALPSPDTILDLITETLSAQSIFYLRALVHSLQGIDASGNGLMDREDLKWAIKSFESDGVKPLRDDQYEVLLDAFDVGKKGYIPLSQFIVALRGGSLTPSRKNLVNDTYDGITAAFGDVTLNILRQAYDVGCEAPFKTIRSKKVDFLGLWTTKDPSGSIKRNEFVDVYKDVSRAIPDDSMFDQLLKNAWGGTNGNRTKSGQTEMAAYQVLETTCKLLDRGGLDRRTKLEASGRIAQEMKKDPLLLELFPFERIQLCARGLMSDADTSIRTAALRVLRYSMINSSSTAQAIKLGIQLFISRSIEREVKLVGERIQALKAIRRIMEIDASQIPTCVVRSLVAIANHKEDNLRRVALETLRELAIANVSVVIQCNGLKTLVDSILDPTCQDLADALLMTVMYLVNEPANRDFIHSFIDVQVLLAPFTDTDTPSGTERRQRWTASRNAVVTMMRSWTGVLLLTSNPQGLQSLVEMLNLPVGDDVKKVVLATICDIFHTTAPLDKNGNDVDLSGANQEKPIMTKNSGQNNLLDNYMVMVLLSFLHCGLLKALISLGTSSNRSALAEPATELLSEILLLSARLLPDKQCAALLALPQLVATTAYSQVDFLSEPQSKIPQDRLLREQAIRSSEMLVELAHAVGASTNVSGIYGTRQNKNNQTVNGVHLASELLRGTNRPLHNYNQLTRDSAREMLLYDLKVHLDNQMDDHTFRDMLMHKCRVLQGKDWFKWNWDIISELLEGPLTNPARLSEAMKTKFFKRVSGFFRCDNSDKGYFAGLPWTPDYVPYLRPACQMYTLLLNHPEGIAFLKTDRRGQLLNEISSALELEARPEAAIVESHLGDLQARMFSPDFCSRRMLREYFTLLGLMSSSPEGLKMMQRIFSRLTKLGTAKPLNNASASAIFGNEMSKTQRAAKEKSQGHDFLCRLILANLDYTVEGSSRQLLTDWMNMGSESLRLYATCLLLALLRSEVEDFERWGIDTLVSQLDKESNVAKAALSVLEEAADTPLYLSAMIKKKPIQLVHMQAESLLLKCLSLPEGLDFLKDVPNWISSNLLSWRQLKHVQYVHHVESQLLRGLFRDKQSVSPAASNVLKPVSIPVTVPNRRSSNFKHGSHREHWGLEWLFRMPWNIEVKLVGPPNSGPPAHLTIDAYVDASETDDNKHDGHHMNTIRIKGLVVDARNIPKPVTVNSQQTLQACLFLGAQPIDRNGYTRPAPTSTGGYPVPNERESSAVAAPPMRVRTESRGISDRLSELTIDSHAYEAPEENKDWSSCGPEHRTASALLNGSLSTNDSERESRLCPHGERAVWAFDLDCDNTTQQIKRVQLKSVEFTIQLLPSKAPTVPLPRHLYGELAKTAGGCTILQHSGHLPEFVACVKDPTVVPLEKRAALWTLGHIAATNRGFDLLMTHADDLVECIIQMATSSSLISLRGTCLFVLGLISKSAPGRRALLQAGWSFPRDTDTAIAVPENFSDLFVWPSATPPHPSELVDLNQSFVAPTFLKSKAPTKAREIIRLIGDLSSTITQKEAGASLNRLKGSNPELFEETETALAAHTMLARYHYRLTARQFIMNLFEKADLSNTALNSFLWKGEDVQPQGRRRRSSVSVPSLSSTIQSLQHTHSKETVLATARHMPDHENTIFVGACEAIV